MKNCKTIFSRLPSKNRASTSQLFSTSTTRHHSLSLFQNSSIPRPLFVSRTATSSSLLGLSSPSFQHLSHQPFHSSSWRMQDQKEEGKGEAPTTDKAEGKTAAELDAKDKRIKELELQVEEAKKNLLYSNADRENIRRIGEENARKSKEYGIQQFAKQLLSVQDNLQRSILSVKDQEQLSPEFKAVFEGVQLTHRELIKVFKEFGVQEFSPKIGDKFDPNSMNALVEIPDPEKESGLVAIVMKNGFNLKDRILRAADVGVTKAVPKAQ